MRLFKNTIKRILFSILRTTQIIKLKFNESHILAFHRIIDSQEMSNFGLRDYEITPENFEEIIDFYESKNFEIVSLDNFIESQRQGNLNKKVVFTFDDGYKDFVFNVLPIVKKRKIPVTVYIVPEYLSNPLRKWDYLLEKIVSNQNSFENIFSSLKIKLDDFVIDINKPKIYQALKERLKMMNQPLHLDKLNDFLHLFGKEYLDEIRAILMSSKDLLEISKEELVTIGSHSFNHYIMSNLNLDELNAELKNSKLFLESLLDKEIEHFTFPYGDFNEDCIIELEKVGYKSSSNTIPRNINNFKKVDLFNLPRYVVKNDFTKNNFLSMTKGFGES